MSFMFMLNKYKWCRMNLVLRLLDIVDLSFFSKSMLFNRQKSFFLSVIDFLRLKKTRLEIFFCHKKQDEKKLVAR